MSKEAGKKVILKVGDGGGTEVFTALAGQSDTRLSLQGNPIDVSDKTTNNWGATIAGTLAATVTVSGYPDWPDTAGWDTLRTHFEAGTTVNCQLVVNNDGDYYQGAFSVTGFDVGGAEDGATEYSITLQAAGALTWTAV